MKIFTSRELDFPDTVMDFKRWRIAIGRLVAESEVGSWGSLRVVMCRCENCGAVYQEALSAALAICCDGNEMICISCDAVAGEDSRVTSVFVNVNSF